MGLIAQRLADYEEIRNDSGWLARDDEVVIGPQTSSGVRVNRQAALGLTTIWRCVDLLSSSVSQAPKDVILKIGGKSFPEFTKPDWLVTPNPLDPTYTINDYFSQVCLSLLLDGNFFVSVYPYVLDPQVLTVLDPALVDVKPGPVYVIRDRNGKVISTLGPMEMLHGTWIRPAGALRGISPLEALRQGMGNAIAAEQHAGRFFGQGAALSFGVEIPGKMDPTKLTDLRESLKSKYAGNRNSHAIGVLTDGAKFVSGLAPTPEQAQMLATRKFSVEDLCRPYGVPPNMAGSQEPGASSYASAEVYRDEFRDYAILPLATRIEIHHNRLVQVPDHISDVSASAQFKFNLDHVARTSLLNRYEAYSKAVQGGFMTPYMVLALEDIAPPDPNAKDPGDMLYMQRQMVPLKDLATASPIPGAAVDAALTGKVAPKPALEPVRSLQDVHIHMPPVPTEMSIPAPIVNVAAPLPNPAPLVTVNVRNDEMADAIRSLGESIATGDAEELRAVRELADRAVVTPIVNVTTPDVVRMEIVASPKRVTKRVVSRDPNKQIATVFEESADG